jgi:hypothetical protein
VSSPRWLWFTFLVGSALLLAWGIWVLTFTSEPSAVGRIGVAVILIGGGSITAALVGAIAAVGLFRRAQWARAAAWFASVLMIVTVVSSWAGIAGVIGLIASRMRQRT